MGRELTVVLDEGFSYFECPRWHDGRIWLSDFYTRQVVTIDADGRVAVIAEVPGQPSGLDWLPDGRLVVVSMRDKRLLRREPSSELVEHANLSRLVPELLNDMVIDDQGRAFVGNFGFDIMAGAPIRSTGLVRVHPDGTAAVAAEGLLFPNGSVILPDGRLVVAETLGQRLTAFSIDAEGQLSERSTWAAFGPPPDTDDLARALAGAKVAPDGMCADADGAIWVADAIGNRVLRVREGGEIVDEVTTGDLGVFACMLGGDDGRTLYLCAAPSFAEHERRDTRDAQLLSCRVDVPRAGRP